MKPHEKEKNYEQSGEFKIWEGSKKCKFLYII
jgi:hypothetical protein